MKLLDKEEKANQTHYSLTFDILEMQCTIARIKSKDPSEANLQTRLQSTAYQTHRKWIFIALNKNGLPPKSKLHHYYAHQTKLVTNHQLEMHTK